MCDGGCESCCCIECGDIVDSCCAIEYKGRCVCDGCYDEIEGNQPSVCTAIADCSGPHASPEVVGWLIRAVLKGYGLYTDGYGLAKLTGDVDFVYADVFDGRERFIGCVNITSDNGCYRFSYHDYSA